jgi:hypothetical protein
MVNNGQGTGVNVVLQTASVFFEKFESGTWTNFASLYGPLVTTDSALSSAWKFFFNAQDSGYIDNPLANQQGITFPANTAFNAAACNLQPGEAVYKALTYLPFVVNAPAQVAYGMHDGVAAIPDQWDDKCQLLRHEWHQGQHWDKFLPSWFHEIGLKDVYAAPGTLKQAFIDQLGDQQWEFPIVLDIPHPFHYKPSQSVASLNFVNDLEIILNFSDFRQWVQNYKDIADFVDLQADKFSLVTQYYNVPRGVWDSNFPLRAQLNYPAPDWIVQDKIEIIKIREEEKKTLAFNTNTFDRVARYFVFSLQPSTFYQSNDSRYMPHVYLDLVSAIWLEISGDKVGTKIQTDCDVFRKFQERYSQFNETYSYYPGELYYLPLGFDCDIHNPGGGAMNIRPVSTNLNVMYTIDGQKVKRAYESGCHYTTRITPTSTQLEHSKSRFSNGSTYGAISYNATTREYEIPVRVRVMALTLNIVTYHNGQMYSQY